MTDIDCSKLHSLVAWPKDGLESVCCCPVCHSRMRELRHAGLTDRVFYCAPGEWTFYRCRACGTGYLDPRPTVNTMHLAYRNYYTHTCPRNIERARTSLLQNVRHSLTYGYQSRVYRGDKSLTARIGTTVLTILPMYKKRVDRRMRYLPMAYPGASLLDIGFGNGVFIESAADMGWEVLGLDPDPVNVKNARERGLNVRIGSVETVSGESSQYDVVTLSHVIEHMHDPRSALEAILAMQRPGGLLYIDTPNIEAHGHGKFGRHWRGLEPPRHLAIFSWKSLETLLQECGYEICRRVPRFEVYAGLAAKSRAIQKGASPYREKVRFADRLGGVVSRVNVIMDHRNSEFITLIARKPSVAS